LFVATGATDDEVAAWIGAHAKKRPRSEIVVWNNRLRDQRLSDLSPELQEIMEDNIASSLPRNRVVYRFFDVYDLEERRL
jgi:adenosyl cobinamide kinase/adenosyl cobinamide phosphate guanylyltransferase